MHKPAWLNYILQWDIWLDKQWILLICLGLVTILRVPSLSEPYWYLDESMYLTIGNVLNQGGTLYVDVIDHKTPIIYQLARVGSQLNLRMLLLVWMLLTTIAFFAIAKTYLKQWWTVAISCLLFVLLTTLPTFEGSIPNGELFMMGFVALAAWLMSLVFPLRKTQKPVVLSPLTQRYLLLGAGVSLGLAILTKVPALLDAVALILVPAWIMLSASGTYSHTHSWHTRIKNALISVGYIGVGISTSLIGSLIMSAVVGNTAQYLQYGLLYNLQYASNWQPAFHGIPLSVFSFPSKSIILAVVLGGLGLLGLRKKISLPLLVVTSWVWCALFASLLSNRPYPHYFLQLFLPLSLLVGITLDGLTKTNPRRLWQLAVSGTTILVVITSMYLIQVWLYPMRPYKLWYQLATNQISAQEYRNAFDPLVADNYAAMTLLGDQRGKSLYIWGNNPALYALSGAIPADPLLVSFHVRDFNHHDQTLAHVIAANPEYIVVMRDEADTFPQLLEYLQEAYIEHRQYHYFVVWKRQ